MTFQVGQTVTWQTSHKVHVGVILAYVPAGKFIQTALRQLKESTKESYDLGPWRSWADMKKEESYLVGVKKETSGVKIYWPKAKSLNLVEE